jgi:hypothetical protein
VSIEYYGNDPVIQVQSQSDVLEALDIMHTQVIDNIGENSLLLSILSEAMDKVRALNVQPDCVICGSWIGPIDRLSLNDHLVIQSYPEQVIREIAYQHAWRDEHHKRPMDDPRRAYCSPACWAKRERHEQPTPDRV